MFTSLRKLFAKKPATANGAPGGFREPLSQPRARVVLPPRRSDASAPTPIAPVGAAPATLGLPLKGILGHLSPDLMQRVRQMDVGEAEVFVPMQKVVSQITQGAVKISFGELRQSAPPGTFTAENDRDRTLIELPLFEILSRLEPSVLARRPGQKRIVIPPEIMGPFGGQTKVTFCETQLKSVEPIRPIAPPPSQPAIFAPVQPPAPAKAPARVQPPAPALATPRPSAPVAPRSQPLTVPSPAIPSVVARARPTTPTPPAKPISPSNGKLEAEAPFFNFKKPDPAQAPVKPQPVVSPINPASAAPVAPETPAGTNTDIFRQRPATPVVSPINPAPPAAKSAAGPNTDIFRQRPVAPVSPVAPTAAAPAPAAIPMAQAPAAEPVAKPEPVAAAPAVPAAPAETRFLNASLADLSEAWPDALRHEIKVQNLSNSMVGLPLGIVGSAIKQGKVAFPWKAVRSWLKPAAPAGVSVHDGTQVELPLKIVTPLFLAELKAGRSNKKISVDENIPDLFSDARQSADGSAAPATPVAPVAPAAPRPAAPVLPPQTRKPVAVPDEPPTFAFTPPTSATPAAPVAPKQTPAKTPDTNYYGRNGANGASDEESPIAFKKDGGPGTAFLSRYATPSDIVNRTASLQGVEGALIALPDGLLVASKIPQSMNAETIAAFLPQIFGKVTQCTRELRLGDLNNLNFTVGNIPWKIFRVGAIYFAAFGRPGQPLPTAHLAVIAAELDRKAK